MDRGLGDVHGTGDGHPDEDSIRVLHLDDDEAFLKLAAEWLEREADRIEVTSIADPDAALTLLEEADPIDCVVSDFDMPGMDGLEFLERVRERYPDLPFVLFTGKGSEEIASEAISAGVTDYLQKGTGGDRYTVLANRIRNAVSQRRAERQAEASTERVRRMFDRIADAFVAIDRDWRYTYVNEQAATLLGTDAQELLGVPMGKAYPEITETVFYDAFERALEEQVPTTEEGYFEPLDTWFEVRVFPSEDGLSIYFRDVTERRRRERRFNAVFNNTYQFTGLMEPDGTLVNANDTALSFAGVDREDVIGRHLAETAWITEANRDRVRSAVDRARDGEFVRFEMEIAGADGPATVDFSLKPVTGESGAVDLLIPEARDISEQRKRQRRFDAVFNNTYQFIGLLDTDGTLLEANETALEFGGIDRADVIGKKLWEAYWFQQSADTREQAREDFERAADGEFIRHELTVQGANGPAVIDFSLKPVTDADGSVDVIIPEGRDITERKQRERELERKKERLEAFASVVSHDLKNPLSVATGSLQLARETGRDDEAALLSKAEDALGRMDRLIDDLLDLAEKGRIVDDPEPVSLQSTVDRALEDVDHDGTDLDVAVDGTVRVDPPRVVQLLENLLSNAVRYADHVDVRYEDRVLSVADDGPGIPPEDRDQVFEPGYSDTDHGHGFGLAIARDIAEAHGWTLTVTDADLGGARFEIRGVETTDAEVDQLSTD